MDFSQFLSFLYMSEAFMLAVLEVCSFKGVWLFFCFVVLFLFSFVYVCVCCQHPLHISV